MSDVVGHATKTHRLSGCTLRRRAVPGRTRSRRGAARGLADRASRRHIACGGATTFGATLTKDSHVDIGQRALPVVAGGQGRRGDGLSAPPTMMVTFAAHLGPLAQSDGAAADASRSSQASILAKT